MRWVLSFATLVVAALVFEDKARQVAGDAQQAYDGAVTQVREARQAVSQNVEQRPLFAVLIAGGLGYLFAVLTPRR